MEEGLLESDVEDLPNDSSIPVLEVQKNSEGSRYMKNDDYFSIKHEPKIQTLGDFLVFGYYSAFFIFLYELIVLPMMANMTFMIYGGFTPNVDSCGEHDFRALPSSEACELLNEIQKTSNCTPQLSSQFHSIGYEFGYYCDSAQQVKNSISIQMFGMLLGAILFGQLSDLFGRRRIMLACVLGMGVLGYLASTSSDLMTFTLFQSGVLFLTGGTITISGVLLMETIPKEHRVWIFLAVSFSPNYIIFAITAYFSQDWRTLLKVISAFNIPTFICLWLAYESPRWLIQKGALKQAKEIYEKIEKRNGTASPRRQKILEQLIQKEVVLLEKKKHSKKYYFHHLFYTWSMIKYNLVFAFTLFCTALINYALMFNMEKLSGSLYLNSILFGIIRYFFNILYGVIDYKCPSIGRKNAHRWAVSFIIIMLSFVFIVKTFELDYPVTTNIAVLSAVAMMSQLFTVIGVVSGELFPTPIRNIAASFQQIFSRCGTIVSPHFFYFTSFWIPAPYLFMIILLVVNLFAFYFMIPESKGYPMHDHMPHKSERIFNGKSKDKDTEALTENGGNEEIKNGF
ncbi:hypothetical protein FO519_009634 [Halicephalobus sp. NKZ332]|nr:hypothetical protein FO519_009634 [Halicephalobus sp. NKZ332]